MCEQAEGLCLLYADLRRSLQTAAQSRAGWSPRPDAGETIAEREKRVYVYTCLKPIHLKKPQVEYNCHAEYTARRPTPPAPTSPSESPRGCSEGEGRETLSRALPRGLVPLDSHLLGVGVGTGACALPPYLAGTPRSDDRPPTHFFVKKKFIPVCGAAPATQKVSSVRCAESLGGTGGIPHAGGSFFLYEKSVLRESDCLRGRRKEVCTDLTPPLFPSLKKMGIQGGPGPLGRVRDSVSRP